MTARLKLAVRRLGLEPAARRIYFHPKVEAATGLFEPQPPAQRGETTVTRRYLCR